MAEGSGTRPHRALLSVVELGGYPNFESLYRRYGFEPLVVNSVRKAQSTLRREQPAVVVAEFNVDPNFRDRTGNLESLLAGIQHLPDTRVIVFYEREHLPHLERLRQRFPIAEALPYPVQAAALEAALQRLTGKRS